MKVNYIEISTVKDARGSLSFMEGNDSIPFDIKRVYYIYDFQGIGITRGFHAHYKTKQVLFCLSGSVEITFDDGKNKKNFLLNSSNKGVYIPEYIWHTFKNLEDNTFVLVVASRKYEESDYIRKYEEFLDIVKSR